VSGRLAGRNLPQLGGSIPPLTIVINYQRLNGSTNPIPRAIYWILGLLESHAGCMPKHEHLLYSIAGSTRPLLRQFQIADLIQA
jgi:hypothetical protein